MILLFITGALVLWLAAVVLFLWFWDKLMRHLHQLDDIHNLWKDDRS